MTDRLLAGSAHSATPNQINDHLSFVKKPRLFYVTRSRTRPHKPWSHLRRRNGALQVAGVQSCEGMLFLVVLTNRDMDTCYAWHVAKQGCKIQAPSAN